MSDVRKYTIYNKQNRDTSVVTVGTVNLTMNGLLRYILALPETGEYRVYDDSHHGLKVMTVTHLDYWRKT